MHDGLLPGFFLFFLLIGGAVIVFAVMANAKKVKAMQEWAAARGWTYVGRDDSLGDRFGGGPFQSGSARRGTFVTVGSHGSRLAASFNWQYTVSNGKNSTTYNFQCVSMRLPMPVPFLQLTREGFGSKLATRLGVQDIRFEWNEFNDEWRVQSASEKFAFDIVHQQFMERLMQPDMAGLAVRFEGQDVVTWTSGAIDVRSIDARLIQLAQVLDQIRPYVWQQLGGR